MRSHLRLALLLLSSSPCLGAQIPNNLWNYPSSETADATSFTSRADVPGSSQGYIYKRFLNYRAIGNPATPVAPGVTDGGTVVGWHKVIQDQDSATQDQMAFFLVKEDANNPGLPPTDPLDVLNGGANRAPEVLFSTELFNMPVSSGVKAWIFTTTLWTPVPVEERGELFLGVFIDSNPAWPSDGLSCHAAFFTAGTTGGNPNANAPDNTWIEDLSVGGVSQPALPRNPRFGLRMAGAVLEIGADIDPVLDRNGPARFDYGMAGRFPDQIGRGDGMSFRVIDANNPGASVSILINLFPDPGPSLVIPGVPGYLSIAGPGILEDPVAAGSINGSGVFEYGGPGTIFAYPNAFPIPRGFTIRAQGVLLGAGGVQLTNACDLTQL